MTPHEAIDSMAEDLKIYAWLHAEQRWIADSLRAQRVVELAAVARWQRATVKAEQRLRDYADDLITRDWDDSPETIGLTIKAILAGEE